jgi:drug/metabolite transporter (DMT)-like permease
MSNKTSNQTENNNNYTPQWRLFDSPYLLLLFTILFWSLNTLLGRAIHGQIPPIGLAFWRWLCGFLIILIPGYSYVKKDWLTLINHRKIIILLSILGIASFNTLLYKGLQFTTAINALLVQSIMPLVVVVISYLFFQETLSPLQCLGVFISFSGAITIIARGDWHILTTLSFNQGDLIILIAVVCYACYSILLRFRPMIHPLSFLTVTFALGAAFLFPLYLWETFTIQRILLNRVTFLSIGYVGIFPSIIAYLCYNRGVELVGANRASLFLHLSPVIGSIMAVFFLKETLQWFHGLGFVMIISGLFLVIRNPSLSLK